MNVLLLRAKSIIPVAILVLVLYWLTVDKHYGLLIPIIAILLFLIGVVAWDRFDIKKKRRQGLYPEKGQITMEDVKRLALSGHDELSLRAYIEITGDTPFMAQNKINRIKKDNRSTHLYNGEQKSINQKDKL